MSTEKDETLIKKKGKKNRNRTITMKLHKKCVEKNQTYETIHENEHVAKQHKT